MSTKQKILDAALTLFAEKGYTAVYVGDIAAAVGIKAPSLYKHFKSKQDIFGAILDEMKARYDRQTAALKMNGNDSRSDAETFACVSEDELVHMGLGLFGYFLHDEYVCKFRKMLTVEQFHNPDLSSLYSKQYIDEPLAYQGAIFAMLSANGLFRPSDFSVTALHFYAPIYMMLTVCDRQPEREAEALKLIENHIRQFNRLYKQGESL